MNQVVVMPYPGRGHINPLLNLCHLFSSRFHLRNLTTVFTVVVTEEWLKLIDSDPKPDNVRFATIPNVMPSEINRGSDAIGFFAAAQNKLEAPFDRLLDCLEQPVNFIIADATLRWSLDVANRRNIPVAAYWPMSASNFTLWYHCDLLQEHHHIFADLSGRGEEYVDYIPGFQPIKVTDFPVIDQRLLDVLPDLVSINKKAQFLLLATVYELEPEAIDAIKHKFQIPVYAFGPNIPNLRLQPTSPFDNRSYFTWLDSKPAGSVLYISLGSYLSVSGAEMDEIWAGLKQSGVNFLLIARGEAFSRLSRDCGSNGLVTEWCDQLRVLLHSSVGGFLSHCGWNSIKESVFSGVPMLTFPIMAEQLINSKVIVEDWKTGQKVRTGSDLVARAEIAAAVRRFMDGESVERKEMMKRVKELEGICGKSVSEGGSAIREIDSFIRDHLASQ